MASDQSDFNIKLRRSGETYILDVCGALDIYNSNQLTELFSKMIEKEVSEFIVNLELATAIDSSGIGALISLFTLTQQSKGKFCIANVGRDNQKIMELSRLDDFFPIADTIDDALRRFAEDR